MIFHLLWNSCSCLKSISVTVAVILQNVFPVFRTFAESFHSLCPEKPWVTKLSSAGLVYLHFGRQLLAQLTQLKEGDRQLEVLFDKVGGERRRIYSRQWINGLCILLTTQTLHWNQIFLRLTHIENITSDGELNLNSVSSWSWKTEQKSVLHLIWREKPAYLVLQ